MHSGRKRHGPVALVLVALGSAALMPARPGAVAAADEAARGASQAEVGAPARTGKERLSGKASDEQRVDNCKVPPALRGPKSRPDRCAKADRAAPTH